MLLSDFKERLKDNKACSFLGVPRVRPKVMVHKMNEAQYCNHDRTKRTLEPKVIGDNMDVKIQQGSI
jgi:hypothetical protein